MVLRSFEKQRKAVEVFFLVYPDNVEQRLLLSSLDVVLEIELGLVADEVGFQDLLLHQKFSFVIKDKAGQQIR